jgi:hypothetical protein
MADIIQLPTPIKPIVPGSPEDLERHNEWLYGEHGIYPKRGQRCLCENAYRGLGRLYNVTMGKGWVRMNTHPDCPHHGTEAQDKWRADHNMRKLRR